MKSILVRDAPKMIVQAEDFKAGDLYGIAWLPNSPLYPAARRTDSMPEEERSALLFAMKVRQEAPANVETVNIPEGLYYLVSSYGVPVAWITCEGTVHRTKLRYSTATANHTEIGVKGLQELSQILHGR